MYLYDEAELSRRARSQFRLPTHFYADLVTLRREGARARAEAFGATLAAIGRLMGRLAAPVLRWKRYRSAVAELRSLDERTLADIGITRADIPRVAAGLWLAPNVARPAAEVAAPANVNVRRIAA